MKGPYWSALGGEAWSCGAGTACRIGSDKDVDGWAIGSCVMSDLDICFG